MNQTTDLQAQDALHSRHARILGCLLGCAVGDSIGLPYEGLSRRRAQRFSRLPLRHRFLFGHGMVSDDTDHTIFVLQSLLAHRTDVKAFRNALSWRMRLWLLTLPAGIGLATLRSTTRMWLGLRRPGVWSAGNGPSMRSAIAGVLLADNDNARLAVVKASTELTHTDPRALAAALAVAEVAARVTRGEWAVRPDCADFVDVLTAVSEAPDWLDAVRKVQSACEAATLAKSMTIAEAHFGGRNGVTGYAMRSVPFALTAWYVHFRDYRATIDCIVQAGGDVDTVRAIAGALAGTSVTEQGIPEDWIHGICDWPHGVSYLRQLAATAASGGGEWPRNPSTLVLAARGVVFTIIVLAHGLRRLLPPY